MRSEPLTGLEPEEITGVPADWLPIREVARITGVNPVTLRAWERRYGLIVPQRTAKGHRLYDPGQVERIQQVLAWINRGAAVSQIKALLETCGNLDSTPQNPWQEERQGLLDAIARLAERSLDDRVNRAMSIYPPRTLCEHLLLPVLASLDQRGPEQYGGELERVFFHSWLRSKLGARLYHHNRQQSGAPLLLMSLSAQPLEPGLWLTAWLVSGADCPLEVLDWPVPPAQIRLAQERLNLRALVLYASSAIDARHLRALPKLAQSSATPLLLAGPATLLHRAELADQPNLRLADDPIAAFEQLARDGLLERTAP